MALFWTCVAVAIIWSLSSWPLSVWTEKVLNAPIVFRPGRGRLHHRHHIARISASWVVTASSLVFGLVEAARAFALPMAAASASASSVVGRWPLLAVHYHVPLDFGTDQAMDDALSHHRFALELHPARQARHLLYIRAGGFVVGLSPVPELRQELCVGPVTRATVLAPKRFRKRRAVSSKSVYLVPVARLHSHLSALPVNRLRNTPRRCSGALSVSPCSREVLEPLLGVRLPVFVECWL